MVKKIQDYLPYYIGCLVLIDNNEYGVLNGGTFVPNSCNQIYYDIQTDEMKENEEDDFSMPYNDDADEQPARIKPILRKLDNLQDVEMIEMYNIEKNCVPDPELDFDIQRLGYGNIITRLDMLNVRFMFGFGGQYYKVIEESNPPTIEPMINQFKLFHYLLSKHFDLFSLIESGLAIDATTLPK